MSFNLVTVLLLISSLSCQWCWVIDDDHWKRFSEMEKMDNDDSDNFIDDDDVLDYEDLMRANFAFVYPGTKWCGPGDIADGYDDLGTAVEADKCCRDHDNCPDIILAGDTKHNLTNDARYTRLSCTCDENFRKCLRNANTKTAKRIGLIYFNALGTSCFRKDYLTTGCLKKGGWVYSKCLEYEYDTSSTPTYQWFDVPDYGTNI